MFFVFLQDVAKNESLDNATRNVAKLLLDKYEFPVTIFLVSPGGDLLNKINVNVLLEKDAQQSDGRCFYAKFLDSALLTEKQGHVEL